VRIIDIRPILWHTMPSDHFRSDTHGVSMHENIWTGPALSNPRNKRRMMYFVALPNQDDAFVASMRALKIPEKTAGVTIVGLNGMTIVGDIDICDFTVCPSKKTVRFHFWERTEIGRGGWRVCYEINVDTTKHSIHVTPIDVAPDDPSVASPASPA